MLFRMKNSDQIGYESSPQPIMINPTLIPFDCPDDEVGLFMSRALEDLKKSADEIFNRATSRMSECQNRIDSYRKRLAVVERKFDALQQSDELPLITSPAEFPGKLHLGRPTLLDRCAPTPFATKQLHLKPIYPAKPLSIKEMVMRKNGYRFIFPRGKYSEAVFATKTDDRLSFALKFSAKKRGFIRAEDFYSLKFAGDVDSSFASSTSFASNSLLIYDNLKSADVSDPFTYKPGMGNLTDFDLPEVLPQLTGVAKNVYAKRQSLFGDDNDAEDDIFSDLPRRSMEVDLSARSTFYMDDSVIFQRSVKIVEPIPSPSISKISSMSSLTELPSTSKEIVNAAPDLVIPPSNAHLTPVAPPRSIANATSNPQTVPPAPPPPPPPSNLLASIPSPPVPSGRADLMAAIRKAGGVGKAGLKKIEKHDDETMDVPVKKPVAAESTDDLMSSLTKALERRRKGISGKTTRKLEALEKPRKTNTDASFPSLRELIPPPSRNNESADSESENEDDWR